MNNVTKAHLALLDALYEAGPKGIYLDALRKKLSNHLGCAVYQACFGNESGDAGGSINSRLEEVLEANLAEGNVSRVCRRGKRLYRITPVGMLELAKLLRQLAAETDKGDNARGKLYTPQGYPNTPEVVAAGLLWLWQFSERYNK